MTYSDFIASGALVLFVLGFALLGFAFLRKKRRERIDRMTAVLESETQLPEAAATTEAEGEESEPPIEGPPAPLPKRDLSGALSPTRQGWVSKLSRLFTGSRPERSEMIERAEEILFSADIGVKTSDKLLSIVRQNLDSDANFDVMREKIADAILQILKKVEKPDALHPSNGTPSVIMFVGVNGVGKTTTIGKIAAQLSANGNRVVLGAGDTFRAAAAEQLGIWATRSGSEIVRGQEAADPASVLFDAVSKAKESGASYVLCDTAGRLHTKTNLMDELKKVHKVLGKACEGAPHEVLLVLDATTGQNAIEQARQFQLAAPLTGVILTKLDGTAKGGVVIGIADELGIPIRYIGVGEGVADLRPFIAEEFVSALFGQDE